MGSLRDGLMEGLKGAYCSYINALPDWYKNWSRLTTPQGLNQVSDWVTRSLCNRPPTEDDYPPPTKTPGKCDTLYDVLAYRDGVAVTPFNWYIAGPIQGERHLAPLPYNTRWTLQLMNGQGIWVSIVDYIPPQTPSYTLTRTDGLPDDCEVIPFDPGPFEPTPINIDIDVTYGPNNEYNLIVPVIIAPVYVAFDGTLNAPVTFNISPDISLEGTWTLFPDANLTIKFPTSGDGGPGDRGDDEPVPDTEHDDSSEDDPETPGQPDDPEERPSRIHFLLCRAAIQDNSPTGSIFQEVGPDIYIPRLGSARFGATIDGVTFWTEDIDIKGLNSIIECPIPFGATRFTVNAARGVVINYSPVSADAGPWPNYLEMGQQFTSDRR